MLPDFLHLPPAYIVDIIYLLGGEEDLGATLEHSEIKKSYNLFYLPASKIPMTIVSNGMVGYLYYKFLFLKNKIKVTCCWWSIDLSTIRSSVN